MIVQRQVPARPSARQPGTRGESAASEDPFAKVLSGQQHNKDGANATKRGEASDDALDGADDIAEATTTGHDTDDASGAGSDEMMALLDSLMSSASYSPDAAPANPDAVVEDGIEALLFLRREGEYADAVRPELILLDLILPKKDGREVLLEIKNDSSLRRIPVVVMTSSSDEKDILAAYDRHVNAYITKPFKPQDLEGLVVRMVEALQRKHPPQESGDASV